MKVGLADGDARATDTSACSRLRAKPAQSNKKACQNLICGTRPAAVGKSVGYEQRLRHGR
jgi:hypothetical protein